MAAELFSLDLADVIRVPVEVARTTFAGTPHPGVSYAPAHSGLRPAARPIPTLSATAVLLVAVAFGLIDSPYAVLALPTAYLIGFSIGAIAMLLTATATTIGAMNNFFTLFILPMFYVSGVFFPLDRLPEWVQRAAWVLPLTPSAALVRGLVTGDLSWWMVVWVLELVAVSLVALKLASYFMRRRLIK